MTNEAGLGRLYLLVPAGVNESDPYVLNVPRKSVLSNILRDDTVIVRCGPISHVAVVYNFTEQQDRILFIDPLYEYWQPSHNACMSGYQLVDGPNNGYLVSVSASEVSAILQGVITRRAALPSK